MTRLEHISLITDLRESAYDAAGIQGMQWTRPDFVLAMPDAYFKDYEHYKQFWQVLKSTTLQSSRTFEQHILEVLHLAQMQGTSLLYPVLDMQRIYKHWPDDSRQIRRLLQVCKNNPHLPAFHSRQYDWLRSICMTLQYYNSEYHKTTIGWNAQHMDKA